MGMRFGWMGSLMLAAISSGCGDDGSAPGDGTDSDPTGSGESAPSSTGPSTTDSPTSDPGTTGPSTTDSDTTGTSAPTTDPTDPTAESSTGDPMLCGITEDPGQTGPWFRLDNAGVPVAADGTLALECGGQGSLMFYLRSTQGGFLPAGETVYYAVTLDVPGFDELSPNGHFFQDPNYGVDVGCGFADEFDGGFSLDGIAILPPDALTDPSMVDGAAATLHVEMLPPDDDPVVLDVALTLMVDPKLSVEDCFF